MNVAVDVEVRAQEWNPVASLVGGDGDGDDGGAVVVTGRELSEAELLVLSRAGEQVAKRALLGMSARTTWDCVQWVNQDHEHGDPYDLVAWTSEEGDTPEGVQNKLAFVEVKTTTRSMMDAQGGADFGVISVNEILHACAYPTRTALARVVFQPDRTARVEFVFEFGSKLRSGGNVLLKVVAP